MRANVQSLVWAYVDGEMDEHERKAFEAVLGDDEMLQRMVAVSKQLDRSLRVH